MPAEYVVSVSVDVTVIVDPDCDTVLDPAPVIVMSPDNKLPPLAGVPCTLVTVFVSVPVTVIVLPD